MKVVFIITRSDEIGGAQVHVRDIASRMVVDGHDVTVLVGGNGPLISQLNKNNVRVFKVNNLVRSISPLNDLKAYCQIKKTLKMIKPDLVTVHSSKAGLLGRLAAKACGYPVVFTAHGWAFTDGVSVLKKNLYKYIEKIGASYSDKIINVSNRDRQLALANKIGDPSLHVTIHNGVVDFKNNSAVDRQECVFNEEGSNISTNDSDEILSIIMVARFSEQKDHETLLCALSKLKEFRWNLKLIGTGPKYHEIKSLAKKLNLENSVEFLGECFDVPDLLENSDLFVLTTNWEGLPISIIEAMRARLPIIASNVGGVNELLEGDLSWGLVAQKDITSVRDRIMELIYDKKKMIELGRLGRYVYENKFSFEKMYMLNCEVYKQVCSSACKRQV